MIHHLKKRLHRLRDAFVIVNPTHFLVHLALDVDLDLKTMPVHLTAFMVLRQAR